MPRGTEIANNKLHGAKSLSGKKLITTALVLFAFVGLTYQFAGNLNTDSPVSPQAAVTPNSEPAVDSADKSSAQNDSPVIPVAAVHLIEIDTEVGKIRVELYPEHAPGAVSELIKLTESGYYDSDTLMQSQPRLGFAIAKLGQSLKKFEFEDEPNQLTSRRGSMAIAKSSASPAYLNNLFFGYANQPELEKHYVIIGQIIDGLELIEKSPSSLRIKVNSFKLIDRNQAATEPDGFSG